MVVGAIIHHWVLMVAGEESGPEGFRQAVQWLADFFYKHDVLIAYPWLACIYTVLDVLMGVVYRVGLFINITKTLGVVCQLCQIAR